jgi:hypothetical protein
MSRRPSIPEHTVLGNSISKLRALAMLFEFLDEPPFFPNEMKEITYGFSLFLEEISEDIRGYTDELDEYQYGKSKSQILSKKTITEG